jgi:glyoxylase-like metal-dependent hydrolase (beta-lactamase superfamily II)
VHVLQLGSVVLPDWHPRADEAMCPIQACVVEHPDGLILFDTGVADDHALINELYRPTVVPVVDALHRAGLDERDVVAIVNSHLHFDHCGQNRAFPTTPVWVQRAEYELVDTPGFTVSEWARLPPGRLRLVDGDADLADGVRVVATPGHTPGHHSLVVDDGRRVVLGGQCCYRCSEFAEVRPTLTDAHGESWYASAQASIERLHALYPDVVHLSHDPTIWKRPSCWRRPS